MTTDLAKPDTATAELMERVVIGGDLSKPSDRTARCLMWLDLNFSGRR